MGSRKTHPACAGAGSEPHLQPGCPGICGDRGLSLPPHGRGETASQAWEGGILENNLSCPELEFVGKTRAIPTVRRPFSAFLYNKTMEKLIPVAPPAFPHPLSGSSRWVKIPIIRLLLFLEDRLGKGGFALPCTPCIPTR